MDPCTEDRNEISKKNVSHKLHFIVSDGSISLQHQGMAVDGEKSFFGGWESKFCQRSHRG